jgi:hypothetical protein
VGFGLTVALLVPHLVTWWVGLSEATRVADMDFTLTGLMLLPRPIVEWVANTFRAIQMKLKQLLRKHVHPVNIVIAPSVVPEGETVTPKALTLEEVRSTFGPLPLRTEPTLHVLLNTIGMFDQGLTVQAQTNQLGFVPFNLSEAGRQFVRELLNSLLVQGGNAGSAVALYDEREAMILSRA